MHRPFEFQCPRTGCQVQGIIDDELVGPNTIVVPVDCPICNRLYLIDPSACNVPREKPKIN